jgi:hypothetical protein
MTHYRVHKTHHWTATLAPTSHPLSSSLHGLGICLFRLHTASRHLFFGLPISLFPEGLQLRALFGNLVSSILFICCNQLLRYCSIVSFTGYIFGSVLIISFVIWSSFVQPLVFRRKFISVLCILVWTFLVGTQISLSYIKAGIAIVL